MTRFRFILVTLGIIGLFILTCLISCKSDSDDIENSPVWILTIGDSNGAGPGKWPDKLTQVLSERYHIINNSQSGRTIGFDNLGREDLNTLKQIDRILKEACRETAEKGGFDKVLICLGTNDCKAVFDSLQSQVTPNLEKLVQAVLDFKYPNEEIPEVSIISPPPYGREGATSAKYKDGDKKVAALLPQFQALAEKLNCDFINIHAPMEPLVEMLISDGIHFKTEGYQMMAGLIAAKVDSEKKSSLN